MFKFLTLLFLTTVIFMQTVPAYCGGRTTSLEVSATLPEHVMENNNQLTQTQTQTVIRNNKIINLTSIVVP